MTTMLVSEARVNLNRLPDEVDALHKPVIINGKRSKGILIALKKFFKNEAFLRLLNQKFRDRWFLKIRVFLVLRESVKIPRTRWQIRYCFFQGSGFNRLR